MTVPTHFKFSVRGTFRDSPEIWNYSFKVNRAIALGPDAGIDDINVGAVTSALQTFHASAIFHSNHRLIEWRAYQIGTDGKTQGNPKVTLVNPPNGTAGTGSAVQYPPQVALCITSVAANRGPARLGRFYLPAVSKAVAFDWRLSAVEAMNVGTTTATMIDAVTHAVDIPGTTAQAALVNISASPAGTGTKQEVVRLEVGRVFDTIKTRRTSLLEEREKVADFTWDLV